MTTRVLIAVLAVYAAAVSQAQARSMLQDAEVSSCMQLLSNVSCSHIS